MIAMKIVWDEPKRLSNIAKHHLDFTEMELGFDFGAALVIPARSSRTGRSRQTLVGDLRGTLLVAAIVSPLGSEALSIVSLRPANKKEQRLYER